MNLLGFGEFRGWLAFTAEEEVFHFFLERI